MAISGIGVIESGLDGLSPVLLPQKYSGKTAVYNIPYLTSSDLAARGNSAISSSEEFNQNRIIENQLVGIMRTHTPAATGGTVVFQGVYTDKSNHPLHELIVSVSGIAAFKNNMYIGDLPTEYVWSGLSHTQANFLWLSIIEQPNDTLNYKSSREFRDFETRSTTNINPPTGIPEGSVLVATYISGIGINSNPNGLSQFISVLDHTNTNQNPHGTRLLVDQIVTSGITVLNDSIWNANLSGGTLTSGLVYTHLKYLNGVTQYGTFICSGILGNIFSGNTSGTFFQNVINLTVDPGSIGYLTVVSGLNVSGSIFHNIMNVNSGVPVDTVDLDMLKHMVSQTLLSGSTFNSIPLHKHFLGYPSMSSVIQPKYPGGVLFPQKSVGRRNDKAWEYNTDLGPYLPTLRHKGSNTGLVYIRQFMPYGYNTVESINITNKIDGGSPASTVAIRDCTRALLTPRLGNALTSSGMAITTVSGFSQIGFSHLLPFDIEITINTTSGLSQYLGTITTNFLATRP